ncbi:YtzI protein [Sediminibacillus massiliensis]|nr:YtzI protein [Sediminibacillus massiliensis]
MMVTVSIISVIIVALVIGLSLLTTSKGYAYKHTIDPLPQETEEKSNNND